MQLMHTHKTSKDPFMDPIRDATDKSSRWIHELTSEKDQAGFFHVTENQKIFLLPTKKSRNISKSLNLKN